MGRVSSTAASTLGSGVSSPNTQNISLTNNTETAITLPAGTRRFIMQMRNGVGFEVRDTSGSLDYWTIFWNNCYTEVDLSPTSTYIVYITPPKDGVLEVRSWS